MLTRDEKVNRKRSRTDLGTRIVLTRHIPDRYKYMQHRIQNRVVSGAVVVERRLVGWESCESWKSEQVGLTSLVQLPDVITLTSWS